MRLKLDENLFRPGSKGVPTVNDFVMTFLRHQDLPSLSGCLVVIDPDRVRVRRPDEPRR